MKGVNFTQTGPQRITATITDTTGTKIAKSIDLSVAEATLPQPWIDFPAQDAGRAGLGLRRRFRLVVWPGPLDPLYHIPLGAQPASTTIELDITPMIPGSGTYTIGLTTSDHPGH